MSSLKTFKKIKWHVNYIWSNDKGESIVNIIEIPNSNLSGEVKDISIHEHQI